MSYFRLSSVVSIPKGPMLAVAISTGLAIWMSTGPGPSDEFIPPHNDAPSAARQSVRTTPSTAQETTQKISLEGDTSAKRRGTVTARISGIISEVLLKKGSSVIAGETIAIIDAPGFTAKMAEVRARRDEAQRSYDNTLTLSDRGLASKDSLGAAKTSLAAAEAQWAAIMEQRDDITLSAPFGGILNDISVEYGDSVSIGTAIAEVLDLSNLTIKSSIPQAQISQITLGQMASVTLVTGETVAGRVTYISSQADRETRSFPIEIQVQNTSGLLRAGVSASIELEGARHMTHAIAAAYLSLSPEGELVVKAVKEDVVVSYPVNVISSGPNKVLIAGLPKEVDIITVGQGFVKTGDLVSAHQVGLTQ